MLSYKFLDHATDMIVQVDAPNLEEAFVQAGRAVVDTTINASSVRRGESLKIEASGSELYSWLGFIQLQRNFEYR